MQSWFSQESQEEGSWPEQVPLQSTSFPSGPALRNRRSQSEPGKIFGFENSTTGYTCNLQPVRPLISAKCPQATGQSQQPTREPLQVKMLCLAPKDGGLFFVWAASHSSSCLFLMLLPNQLENPDFCRHTKGNFTLHQLQLAWGEKWNERNPKDW